MGMLINVLCFFPPSMASAEQKSFINLTEKSFMFAHSWLTSFLVKYYQTLFILQAHSEKLNMLLASGGC